MSTPDVPGANPVNNDALGAGCWAESAERDDNSLIYVLGIENGKVIFLVYDLKDGQTPLFFHDSMHESDFKKYFSWDPKSPKKAGGKWTWHDKTGFPWDRILAKEPPHGQSYVFARDQLSAAERVADYLKKRMREVDMDQIKHMSEQRGAPGQTTMEAILSKLGRILDRFAGE